MHEDATAPVQALLDEAIGIVEMIDKFFIFYVVNIDGQVLISANEVRVNRPINNRNDVSDLCCFQSIFSPERDEAGNNVNEDFAGANAAIMIMTYPPM